MRNRITSFCLFLTFSAILWQTPVVKVAEKPFAGGGAVCVPEYSQKIGLYYTKVSKCNRGYRQDIYYDTRMEDFVGSIYWIKADNYLVITTSITVRVEVATSTVPVDMYLNGVAAVKNGNWVLLENVVR